MCPCSNHRAGKIERVRHEHGGVAPPEVLDCMSAQEHDYFKGYSKLLEEYMMAMDIDLTADLQPPKNLFLEVRVLRDCGEISTFSGTVVLKKGEYLLMRRTDAEPLIRQGMCEETGRRRAR